MQQHSRFSNIHRLCRRLHQGLRRAPYIALAVSFVAAPGCTDTRQDKGNDRWVTTENTKVAIDWDKVNTAYLEAQGPADFEQKVNEIYEGDEIISVAVADQEDKSQLVTGFFDNDNNGQVGEGEKIFTIQRDITGEGAGQYQTTGYGHYAGYHSPMMSFATGMLMGSLISGAFSPAYRPVAYVTSADRRGQLTQHRNTYRANNPGKFSKSGRNYNSKGTRSWGSGSSGSGSKRSYGGGGRFGIRGRKREHKPERLTA